eukprot:TRINITY_DN41062_c0_g1_i1.p1 TRINITY_DN41062_c0_g1~~TRINITY_DN41062_c0_g1_i1.p1  ORF type:complete len:423 (-),score=63.22 TRINITY_DN41062_c0_g1_i1:49-1149(-)
MAHERWAFDRPAEYSDMHLLNFNNWLIMHLTELRSYCKLRGANLELWTSLEKQVHAIVSDIPGLMRTQIQGSSSRATSIYEAAGLDCGPATASDVDIVVVFNPAFQDLRACLLGLSAQLKTKLETWTWKSHSGKEFQVQVDEGRFGFVAAMGQWMMVDVIPAVHDPDGGHWILDQKSNEVLHNNPAEFAARVSAKQQSAHGWADVVVLCKFWNKRRKVMCADGVQRAPLTSLHIEAALTTIEEPIPLRIDEAFHTAIITLREQLLKKPVPESWTGRPVAQYLLEDKVRREAAELELSRAESLLESVVGVTNMEVTNMARSIVVLREVFALSHKDLTRITGLGFPFNDNDNNERCYGRVSLFNRSKL